MGGRKNENLFLFKNSEDYVTLNASEAGESIGNQSRIDFDESIFSINTREMISVHFKSYGNLDNLFFPASDDVLVPDELFH